MEISENQNSFTTLMEFKHPLHIYHQCLALVREDNKQLALQLLQHLKAGRNKRAIQQIDRQLKEKNILGLRGLKQLITSRSTDNAIRVEAVKTLTRRLKMLHKRKRQHVKQIKQKPLRRQIKQKYESNIQNINNQLYIVDHKKHHKDLRSEQAEIPIRFANVQFGGANGNKIQKVMSTTRNIMSHYDLEFHADNYRFDFSENRITALIHLLNKSLPERTQFYQQQLQQSLLEHHHGIKVHERLLCLFETVDEPDQKMTAFPVPKEDSHYAQMLNSTFLQSSNIHEMLQHTTHIFCEAVAESEMNRSGFVFICALRMLIDVYMYEAPSGSNYIPLPKEIENRKSTTNIKNTDQECFKYCCYCHFEKNDLPYEFQNRKRTNTSNKNIVRNPCRVTNYDKYSYLDFSDIAFPVPLEENTLFQIETKNNISINIYGLDQDKNEKYHLYPERLTRRYVTENMHINLLYLTDDEKGHYVYITKYDSLCKKQNSKASVYVCRKCCSVFYKKEKLAEHYEKYDCQSQGTRGLAFVSAEEKWIEFHNHNNKFRSPFIIYADFECFLNNLHDDTYYQSHTPCSYAYKIVCCDDFSVEKLQKYHISTEVKLFRGENIVHHFLNSLFEERSNIVEFLKENQPMHMTSEDYKKFHTAKVCHICEKPFTEDDAKVRDHSHETGKFLGVAHYSCNLHRNYNFFKTPVVFHNAQGYDTHFIIQELSHFSQVNKVSLVPKSEEKYLTYEFMGLKFIDSFSFLDTSLANLVNNLRNDKQQPFVHLRNHFPTNTSLLLRKGVYPYEYMHSTQQFEEICLPCQDDFYSSLTQSHISDEDYIHAINVWKSFQVKNIGEYHDLYLKCDVLQLADVFEHFRNKCLTNFKLDPAHYISTPQFAWDAMLKMTKAKIEIFSEENQDMHLFVEPHIRGGFSQISQRYAHANNKFSSVYDPSLPTTYIMCEDANSLYAGVMRMKLPLDDFSFVDIKGFDTREKLLSLDDNGYYGYAILITATYPDHLHDLHSDLPVMPENKCLTSEVLSEYQKRQMRNLHIPADKTPKLIADFTKKVKYLVHYRRLKLLLRLGIEVNEVHQVLRFHQENWMQTFIDKNTIGRQNATDDFEKRLFKMFSNAPYGKTLENVRKRCNVELVVNNEKRLLKCIAEPRFQRGKAFSETVVAVHRQKKLLKMNKPYLVGFCILELSKMVLHEYWYNVLKKQYGSKIKLLFTDTDSLCYIVETEDIYADMRLRRVDYDFSDYPTDHENYDDSNKKVPLTFKDVSKGLPIEEFVGVKPKTYSWRYVDGSEENKNKGITQNIKHDHFMRCLLGEEEKQSLTVRAIRSVNHEVFTQKMQKVALMNYDNKRFLMDNLKSLPYGHYKIPQIMAYQKDYFEFFNSFSF